MFSNIYTSTQPSIAAMKARKARDDAERDAQLPPGLINHGNTCFMNSTLQGLIATPLLHEMIDFENPPPSLRSSTGLFIMAQRSPQLTNGHGLAGKDEKAWVEGMPLGDVFVETMRKAWSIQEHRNRESMSPKTILTTIGKKYDQYLDFRQQDAHEFLRHMLDAMRMEELDIIKQRQPPPPKRKRTRRKPAAAVPQTSDQGPATATTSTDAPSPPYVPPTDDEKLESFVDMLFGGKLASILVCEGCKKVSLTYEDFNDLSLSIKPEDYVKGRKRDRFKFFTRKLRFRPGHSSSVSGGSRPLHRSMSVPVSPIRRSSEIHAQDEEPPMNEDPRRRSFDHAGEEEVDKALRGAREEARNMMAGKSEERDASAVADDEGASDVDDETETPKEKADGPHVDIVEADKKGKGKEKEPKKEKKETSDSWQRLGRRISTSMRMVRKDKDAGALSRPVERGRRVEVTTKDGTASKKSDRSLTPAAIASELSDASESPRGGRFTPSPMSSPVLNSSPNSTGYFHNLKRASATPLLKQRSKSPLATSGPELTPEETAYLRQILSDVHSTAPNPFAALQQVLSNPGYGSNGLPFPSAASIGAQALWAKLGHLPEIEECLRMFTAVEVLDGENMVGCHRCWKIANGTYKPRHKDQKCFEDDPDTQTDDSEGSAGKENAAGATLESVQEPRQTSGVDVDGAPLSSSASGRDSPSSTSPVSSSATSETSGDVTSATSVSSGTPKPSVAPASPSPAPPSINIRQATLTPSSSEDQPITWGGLPIPSISTTAAPESGVASASRAPELETVPEKSPSWSRPPSALGVSLSDDSLLTPKLRRYPRRSKNSSSSSDDSADESGSDLSGTTSVYSDASSVASVSPTVSPRTSTDKLPETASAPQSLKQTPPPESSSLTKEKEPRSKRVILRRMYKRYLIATPPPILVIHLKRFQQISKMAAVSFSSGLKKLDEYVSFPEFLDLSPFLAPKKEDFGLGKHGKSKKINGHVKAGERCMYRLYAVVVHIGNMLGGHYIAYTALPPRRPASPQKAPEEATVDASGDATASSSSSVASDGASPSVPAAAPAPQDDQPEQSTSETDKRPRQWAYISDQVVRLTTIEEVLKAKAYICMYERI